MNRFLNFKVYVKLFIISVFAVILTACTPKLEQFAGVWVGIDESRPDNIVLYEYEIALAGNNQVSIRVIRSAYEFNEVSNTVSWISSLPRYFPGNFKEKDGIIKTPFGDLGYSVTDNILTYNKINFIRKAKNAELKLREVARKAAVKGNPDAIFTD